MTTCSLASWYCYVPSSVCLCFGSCFIFIVSSSLVLSSFYFLPLFSSLCFPAFVITPVCHTHPDVYLYSTFPSSCCWNFLVEVFARLSLWVFSLSITLPVWPKVFLTAEFFCRAFLDTAAWLCLPYRAPTLFVLNNLNPSPDWVCPAWTLTDIRVSVRLYKSLQIWDRGIFCVLVSQQPSIVVAAPCHVAVCYGETSVRMFVEAKVVLPPSLRNYFYAFLMPFSKM